MLNNNHVINLEMQMTNQLNWQDRSLSYLCRSFDQLYSDKLSLHVVDLTHIELATEEDQTWKVDYWARLFTATRWEDVKMIAEKDIHMKAAAEEMYVLSADELIQQRCRARDDYMKNENTRNRIMKELTEALETSQQELLKKDSIIADLQKQLAEATLKNN